MDISSELKNPSLMIKKYVVDESTYCFVLFLLVGVFFYLAELFFFSASFFVAVFFLFGADLFFGAGFLEALFIFLGKCLFLGVAFFLAASVFFSAEIRLFLNYVDSLYELLIWMKLTEAMTAFNPDRKGAFNHFLSFGILACMKFLIEIMDKPMQSLSSFIALMLPDLYSIVSVCYVS